MSHENTPLISVISATYNRSDKLPRAIQSVLAQAFQEWELIIVDDGSVDGTPEIVIPFLRNPKISYFRLKENRGVGVARNLGISKAKANWIIILDSDNALKPDALKIMAKATQSYPDIKIHKFCVESFDGNSMGFVPTNSATIKGSHYLCGKFKGEHHSLTQRSLLLSIPFFEEVNGGEGTVWAKRALQCDAVMYHPFISQLYDADGTDRLSVRSKNLRRLQKVHWLDIKNLWREYLKSCPAHLLIRLFKCFCYALAGRLYGS